MDNQAQTEERFAALEARINDLTTTVSDLQTENQALKEEIQEMKMRRSRRNKNADSMQVKAKGDELRVKDDAAASIAST